MTPWPDDGPRPQEQRLTGKTAVVMGAGQTPGETIGNGRATAVLFARHGAHVICVDRLIERAEDTVAQIKSEGGHARALGCDILDEQAIVALFATIAAEHGAIDVLHNNVGGGTGDAPPERLTAAHFDAIMALNLRGMWLTIRQALPLLRAGSGSAIVNVSSLASRAVAGILGYEVSKAGVNKLTQTVAMTHAAEGVRCNAILPGLIDTPMAIGGWSGLTGQAQDELRAKRNARVPLGRMGSAWDVASAALWLASDDARFVTGVLLAVDGGQGARTG